MELKKSELKIQGSELFDEVMQMPEDGQVDLRKLSDKAIVNKLEANMQKLKKDL